MKSFIEYIEESSSEFDYEMIDGRARVYCKKELIGTQETKDFINKFKKFMKQKTGKEWMYDSRGTDSDDKMYMDFEKN